MKKIAMMIAALVMTLSANAQFEQGKMYVGASMTGFDASYSGATEFHLGIDAKAGYFFMDNLANTISLRVMVSTTNKIIF